MNQCNLPKCHQAELSEDAFSYLTDSSSQKGGQKSCPLVQEVGFTNSMIG